MFKFILFLPDIGQNIRSDTGYPGLGARLNLVHICGKFWDTQYVKKAEFPMVKT